MNTTLRSTIIKTTSIIAWVLVVIIAVKAAKEMYTFATNETTNDAQINEYINPVIARVGGYIREVRFTDFEAVKKGDTLLIIDQSEYTLDANQIKAEIQKQSANDKVVEFQMQTLKEQAEEAFHAIDAATTKVWKEQLELDRYQQLYNSKSATAQQLEQIQANVKIYKAALIQAEQHYKVAKARVDDLSQEKSVIGAERSLLTELHQRKNLDIGYTVITAPYN